MPPATSLAAFAGLSLAVALSPGPSWLYVIQSSLAGGARGGRWAILGNATGIAGHLLAVAVGIAALLQASDALFTGLKLAGALYLAWLGIRTLADRRGELRVEPAPERSPLRVWRDGVVMSLLNPKISLLMLALLPQFVDPRSGATLPQVLILGLVHVAIASLTLTVISAVTVRTAGALPLSPSLRRAGQRLIGILFLAFGLRLALGSR